MRRILPTVAVVSGCVLFLLGTAATAGTAGSSLVNVKVAPDTLQLGSDDAAVISARLPVGATRVNVHCHLGKVENLSADGKGRVSARYVPPAQFHPAVDIIVLSASDGRRTFWGVSRVRLVGRGKARIVTSPDAVTWLRIGNRRFGPAQADVQGEAFVDVEVPPGVAFGLDDQGKPVDLRLPEQPMTALFLDSGPQMNTEEVTLAKVLVVVHEPDGRIYRGSEFPSVTVDTGEISPLRQLALGVYEADYTVPLNTSGEATFKVDHPLDSPDFLRRIALVGRAGYRDDAVPVPPESPVAEEQPVEPVPEEEAPEPEPVVPPRFFIGAQGGVSVDFSGWISGVAAIDAGIRLPVDAQQLGLGIRGAFLRSSQKNELTDPQGEDTSVVARTTVVPLLFSVWHRYPAMPRLHLFSSLHLGTSVITNRMTSTFVDENETRSTERRLILTVGLGFGVEVPVKAGAIVAGVDGVFYNNTLRTFQGRLITLEALVGYRFFIP